MKQIFASISRTGQPNHPPVPVDTMRHIAGKFEPVSESSLLNLPYVNEEGILVLIDAEGKEVVTGIRVAPVTAVVNEDGSAVLTIIV